MQVSRRSFTVTIGLLPLGWLAGCTGSPVVQSSEQPPAPEPTLSTTAQQAAAALVTLQQLCQQISAASGWEPDASYLDWAAAVAEQCGVQLDQLLSADPLAEPDPIFDAPEPSQTFSVDSPESTDQARQSATDELIAQLQTAMDTETEQPMRLLYASILATGVAVSNPGARPIDQAAEPGYFQDITAQSSIQVALSHVWALIYGLEVGLGRLSSDSDLADPAQQRLNTAKQLRNEYLAQLSEPAKQEPAYELPTAMSDESQIAEGWRVLEGQLAEAQVRLAATDSELLDQRVTEMTSGINQARTRGYQFGYWPGWAKT